MYPEPQSFLDIKGVVGNLTNTEFSFLFGVMYLLSANLRTFSINKLRTGSFLYF